MALSLYVTIASYASAFAEKLHRDERGQDTLEWVLMSGLIAGAIVLILGVFTTALNVMATNVSYCLDFAKATTCSPGF
jgi:Flp pilus assembly pilin Flp